MRQIALIGIGDPEKWAEAPFGNIIEILNDRELCKKIPEDASKLNKVVSERFPQKIAINSGSPLDKDKFKLLLLTHQNEALVRAIKEIHPIPSSDMRDPVISDKAHKNNLNYQDKIYHTLKERLLANYEEYSYVDCLRLWFDESLQEECLEMIALRTCACLEENDGKLTIDASKRDIYHGFETSFQFKTLAHAPKIIDAMICGIELFIEKYPKEGGVSVDFVDCQLSKEQIEQLIDFPLVKQGLVTILNDFEFLVPN